MPTVDLDSGAWKVLMLNQLPQAAHLCASFQNAFLLEIRNGGKLHSTAREVDALEKQLAAAATCDAACEEGLWEAFAS